MTEAEYRRFVAGDFDPRTPRDCGWREIAALAIAIFLAATLLAGIAAAACVTPDEFRGIVEKSAAEHPVDGRPAAHWIGTADGGRSFGSLFRGDTAGALVAFGPDGCAVRFLAGIPADFLFALMPPDQAAIFRAALTGEGQNP